MHKGFFLLGGAGALVLHLSGCGTVNAQSQPVVMNGVGLAVLSESQNAKVGASAVAAWRRRTSTTFEFNASSTVGGKPVNANLLVVVDILNGGIAGMREYTPPV